MVKIDGFILFVVSTRRLWIEFKWVWTNLNLPSSVSLSLPVYLVKEEEEEKSMWGAKDLIGPICYFFLSFIRRQNQFAKLLSSVYGQQMQYVHYMLQLKVCQMTKLHFFSILLFATVKTNLGLFFFTAQDQTSKYIAQRFVLYDYCLILAASTVYRCF